MLSSVFYESNDPLFSPVRLFIKTLYSSATGPAPMSNFLKPLSKRTIKKAAALVKLKLLLELDCSRT